MSRGITEEAHRADTIAQKKIKTYETNYALRQMFTWQNKLLLENIKNGFRVLEIGCGIGNFLADAVSYCDQIYATEVSLITAKIAWSNHNGVRSISIAPAECLPFRDGFFDAIIARGLLHHLENPVVGIREMHRVLKTDGYLMIFEGNPASIYRNFVLTVADGFGVQHEVSQYLHLRSEEIIELLSIFRQFRVEPVNGLLAPFAYVGVGNQLAWKVLSSIREIISRLFPDSFAWWLLWVAQK